MRCISPFCHRCNEAPSEQLVIDTASGDRLRGLGHSMHRLDQIEGPLRHATTRLAEPRAPRGFFLSSVHFVSSSAGSHAGMVVENNGVSARSAGLHGGRTGRAQGRQSISIRSVGHRRFDPASRIDLIKQDLEGITGGDGDLHRLSRPSISTVEQFANLMSALRQRSG